jgi:hypothetical protein
MEPNEIYRPSPMYARVAWAALAGSLLCLLCALRAPLAAVPASLCAITAIGLFWLATRPEIRLGDSQFNIGERAIAWREVRQIKTNRLIARLVVSPLVLELKLTNSRRKALIFPGERDQIARLVFQLRKNCFLASFDGIPWQDQVEVERAEEMSRKRERKSYPSPPVHVLKPEDEEEIERMYQRLKSVGHIDSRGDAQTSDED